MKYYLSVAAIFKNESWGMKEWIEHYKFHGVDHIYLVNDFSTDEYLPIIQPYIESGFITLYQNDNPERYTGRQIDMNNKFFKPIFKESQWLVNIDLDEFLYSPKEINLKKVLKKYESYAGLTVNWVWFNSNGHKKQPPLIVEGFTKRCGYNERVYMKPPGLSHEWVQFNAPKLILNSNFNVESFETHSAIIDGHTINISTQDIPNDPELLINHYQLQSREYWENVKMNRGDVNHWFKGSPRDFEGYDSMDVGDIVDTRLWDQNKQIYKIIGMNNLGNNGRLGNQMFQYASLVGIAKNKSYDFRIPNNCDLVKCFEFSHCGERYGIIDGDEVELHDSHEFCQELFDHCPSGITLNGYFQTEKYFKNVENLLRKDFIFKKEIEDEVNFYYKDILSKNPVSICARHYTDSFDYPGCSNNHRNLPIDYYLNAIQLIGKDRKYIICSNDIDFFRKYFIGNNFIFNDISIKSEKAFFDLCLISKCSDFIISNSTFSWWGAWLANRGKVIAPTPWYGNGLSDIQTDDLYPEGWEKIEC